ncbi:MAG: glycosyltransferase, partial [Candidatus Electrothrix sp. LOE1_4_5]|nr:glycosyltransferase [Candidatus Electrothrix gigas]
MNTVAVIIVTHNSQDVLPRCVDALSQQAVPTDIILVDAGSKDTTYLNAYLNKANIQVLLNDNIGFSRANNQGYQAVSQAVKYILFLNPD